MTPRALLVDFGGVLTTDVFASFGEWSEAVGLPREAAREAFARDEQAQRLLVELETGRLGSEEFGRALAARLTATHGVEVAGTGLVAGLNRGLRPVAPMVAAIESLREAGIPTVLVSNSMGYDAYDLLDLERLFDATVLSGRIGVRKPSRRIYRIGAESAGVEPADCVLIDDLAQNLAGAARLGVLGIHHTAAPTSIAELERHFGVVLTGSPQ